MKLHVFLIIGFALIVTACENEEQVTEKSYYFDGIVKHMHAHADQVDLIDIALADDDLETAKLPARWLWRHDTMSGVPTDWQPYLSSTRKAARAVVSAADLETARAASLRITEQCQTCHTAAGIISKNE